MKRSTLTVEQLENAGYKAYEFSDYTLANAVEYIKSGCETRLEPRHPNHMVAVVVIQINCHKYEKEMFWRPMSPDERVKYQEVVEEQRVKDEKVSARIHARNMAKLRR